jgi:hypothetical protein
MEERKYACEIDLRIYNEMGIQGLTTRWLLDRGCWRFGQRSRVVTFRGLFEGDVSASYPKQMDSLIICTLMSEMIPGCGMSIRVSIKVSIQVSRVHSL